MKKILSLVFVSGWAFNCLAQEPPNLSMAKTFQLVCSEAVAPIPDKAKFDKELSKVVNLYSCQYFLRGLGENIYLMQSLKGGKSEILDKLCLPKEGLGSDYDSVHMFLAYLGKQNLKNEDSTRAHYFVALANKYKCEK